MKLQEKIGVTEIACLLFISNIARIFLSFPQTFAEGADTGAWLAAILSALGSLLIFWVAVLLMRKFPEQSLVEVTEQVLGKFLGTLVNLIYAGVFFVTVVLFNREFGEAMLAATLPQAPISVVIGFFAFGSLCTLFFNLETLARTARLVTPFIVAGFAVLVLAVLPQVHLYYYTPVLGGGIQNIVMEGLVKRSMIFEGLLAALLLPACQGWQHMRKAGFYAVLAGGAVLVVFVTVYEGVFTIHMAKEEALPIYVLARAIDLGRFFQRVESIFLMAWGMVGFIKLAVSIYAGSLILSKIFKLPDYRPILLVSALLTFALSFLPPDFPTTVELEQAARIYMYVPVLFLPLITYLLSLLKKESAHEKSH